MPSAFLLVGLGNPGPEYHQTRHNIGFMILDELLLKEFPTSSWSQGRHGLVADVVYKGRKLRLLKPNTFMNLSGKAVAYHLQDLGLSPEQLLIISDDLALPFGTLRLRGKGSDGGHNGLKSIQDALGHSDYPRLKAGIGSLFNKGAQVDYVLSPFDKQEFEYMPGVLKGAKDALLSFVFRGIANTMTSFNKSFLPAPTAPATKPPSPNPT